MGISGVGGRVRCGRCGQLHHPDGLMQGYMSAPCRDCRYDMQQIALARSAAEQRKKRGLKPIEIKEFYLRPSDWSD